MPRQFKWAKAKRRSRASWRDLRDRRPQGQKANVDRAVALADFAAKHELACFTCGSRSNEWAKTGWSKRRPWAICVPCVRGGS
jgi:hypothetical protein